MWRKVGCSEVTVLLLLLGDVSCSQLSQGITNLAMDMASVIEQSTGKNFVLSPYSAHSAFSQLLLGSKGTTLSEMQRLLGISPDDTAQYSNLRSGLKSSDSQLKIANMLALAQGFKPRKDYVDVFLSRFQSTIKELDFATNRQEAANEINSFVNRATAGNIEKIVEEDQLDDLTRLILINAIYFKAPWKTSFDRTDTFEAEFNTPKGSVRTQYMSNKLKVRLLTDDANQVDVLELPYTDPNKSLLVVLPRDVADSEDLVAKARKLKLSAIRNEQLNDVQVTLPPFRVRSRTNLKDVLTSLGAATMFTERADFSAMSDQSLHVTSAIQDAKIEVTEEGTTAAAATAVTIGLRSSQRSRQFFADRPFLFILYDSGEDVPLFVGKITDPTEAGGLAGPQPLIQRSAVNLAGPAGQQEPVSGKEAEGGATPCAKYVQAFPNAAENVRLCEVAELRKLFEWLRSFRPVCEQSRELHDGFMANNCGAVWCETAHGQRADWLKRKERFCATDAAAKANQVTCKEVANLLSAADLLKCK